MTKLNPKIGVVLSGGGAKGAYEAGALSVIVEKNKDIHVMTGASIGAIKAAIFALEYEKTGDMIKAAEKVKTTWFELGGLFKLSKTHIILESLKAWLTTGSPLHIKSLVNNTKIKEKTEELIPPEIKISDLKK